MKYADKLRDPRWQKLRLKIMERDEWTCQACSATEATLNIHHKQYHAEPWESDPDELETLCEKCHHERTETNKKFLLLSSSDAHAAMCIFEAWCDNKIDLVTVQKKVK